MKKKRTHHLPRFSDFSNDAEALNFRPVLPQSQYFRVQRNFSLRAMYRVYIEGIEIGKSESPQERVRVSSIGVLDQHGYASS